MRVSGGWFQAVRAVKRCVSLVGGSKSGHKERCIRRLYTPPREFYVHIHPSVRQTCAPVYVKRAPQCTSNVRPSVRQTCAPVYVKRAPQCTSNVRPSVRQTCAPVYVKRAPQSQSNAASFSSEKSDPAAPPNLPLAMDQLLVMNTGQQKRTLGDNFDQRLPVTHHSFVTTADNRFLFACGFWDKSFRIYLLDTARIVQVVFGHFDVVTCLARSECNISQDCYLVTGSKDCTVMVWMFSAKSQAILGDNNNVDMPTPRTVLTGHQSEITCVATIAELGLVVSGSKDGPSLVHSLTGDLLHSLEPPSTCLSPRLITVSREAFIILTYDSGRICMFSINGKLLHFMEHKDYIQSLILSRDGQYMLLGGNGGVVEVWRAHNLEHLYTYPVCDSSIRSLALTHDHRFVIAGLATGCLLVLNIDFNKWHHEFQERYT
ncbi:hypothetical protein Btru_024409 [Bulinus truncatus]|nr:hypothetical protein Btru_024409 [Bulinus truncatus]